MAPQLAATSPARKRFLREARTSAQVRHENVVQVYEVGEQPLPYLVMEFIPGETLQQRLDRVGPLDVLETLRIGRQIAEGLAAAHANDLIHRDIKPGNVLLEGGQHKVKITDFGLARAADDASMTQSGMIAGTPLYMAPEQALGKPLDHRLDLFSLGSVMYQMISGRSPFRANNTVAVLKRVVEDQSRAIREIIPETPQWLCDIIAKLHAKDPANRYQSAREVADVLADCEAQLKQNSRLRDYSRIPQSKQPKAGRSGMWRWLAAAAVLLPLLVLAVWAIPFLYRYATNEGTLIYSGAIDPNLENILIKRDGQVVAQLLTSHGIVHLPAGDYEAEVVCKDGYKLATYRRGPFSVLGDAPGALGWEEAVGRTIPLTLTRDWDVGISLKLAKLPVDPGKSPYDGPRPSLVIAPFDAVQARKHQEAWAQHLGVPVEMTNSIGMKLRLIPPGEFMMGTDPETIKAAHLKHTNEQAVLPRLEEAIGRESPRHKVTITTPWFTGSAAVTRGQFRAFAKATGYRTEVEQGLVQGYGLESTPSGVRGVWDAKYTWEADYGTDPPPSDDQPVGNITWNDAKAFCAWLSNVEGRKYDLPTEAQWEYACRAGSDTFWSWGSEAALDRLPEYANLDSNSINGPEVAGRRKPNAFGLFNMQGCVGEWCQDYYSPFQTEAVVDPRGPAVGPDRIERGSTFDCGDPWLIRPALRRAKPLRYAAAYTGFRVVCDAAPVVAKQEPLSPTFTNSLGMEFVLVPKGKSWLGGGKDKLGDQEVEIPADFYLGKYEVTQEEWETVMGENPSWFSRTGKGKDAVEKISEADLARFPVEMVSWDQCQIFAAKLNEREKETGWVYRLPTAMEWEYACRGGPLADQEESAFFYYLDQPTNELLPDMANVKESGKNRTCAVGSYQPNRLGLCDLHGNLSEFCLDEQLDNGISKRQALGGSWEFDSVTARAAFRRSPHPPSLRHQTVGVRLARVPSGAASPAAPTPLVVAPFTDAEVQRIAALPAAQQVEEVRKELKRRNPGFDGTVTHQSKDGVVTELAFIPVKDQDVLTDISPLRALPGLTYLNLWSCSELEDLEPLKGLKLTRLIIGSLNVSNQVRDLEPLRGMKLTELHLYRCQVQDLEPLKDMPLATLTLFSSQVRDCEPLKGLPLTTLRLAYCTQIQDFTPLAGLPLTSLSLNDCRVRDLEPFQGMKLTRLDLVGTAVRDLELLKGMPLKTLSISQKPGVTDLRPLQGLELEEIYLNPRNITQGLEILRDMQSLKTIGIDYSQSWPAAEFWERYNKGEFAAAPFTDADVQRIAALSAAEQVEEVRKELVRLNPGFDGKLERKIEGDLVTELSINTDQIDNIAPVRALTKLVYLDLRGTYPNKGKLSDLSPLKGMTFSRLDCSSTQVSDLSPLAELPLTFLAVNHNPVSDLSPVTKMPLESLAIAETKVEDLSPLKGMKIKVLGAQLLPVTDLSPLAGMPLTGLDLYHTVGVTSLEPLKGMPLEDLNLQDVPVSDLSPLKEMTTLRTLVLQATNVSDLSSLAELKLTSLFVLGKEITDLTPLKGMPLVRFHIYGSGVNDLSPLKGMPLQEFRFDPKNITQGLDVLREIKTLQSIGTGSSQSWPKAEFWERLDKGEFK
jgi:formylglycine-generating enzyme required for sulfatase activity/Leucine-rich repeat (LRR) protein